MLINYLTFTHVTLRDPQPPLTLLTLLNELRLRRTNLGLPLVKSLGTSFTPLPTDNAFNTLQAHAHRVNCIITFNDNPSHLLIQQHLRTIIREHNLTNDEVYIAANLGTKKRTLLTGRLSDNPNLYTLAAIAECLGAPLTYGLQPQDKPQDTTQTQLD